MRNDFWENIYQESPVESLPWFSPLLDWELKDYLEAHEIRKGRFLDLGTGPATQGIELAKLGFDVTATDISPTAVDKARERAEREGVHVEYLVDDILETGLPSAAFDYIYDRGVFHTLEPEERDGFARTIRRIIKEGGTYFVKCFSTRTPGTWGPHRFTKREIVTYFSPYFEIQSIDHSVYQSPAEDDPRTLFCIMKPR
jgi:SAM-dependent methyltransferase